MMVLSTRKGVEIRSGLFGNPVVLVVYPGWDNDAQNWSTKLFDGSYASGAPRVDWADNTEWLFRGKSLQEANDLVGRYLAQIREYDPSGDSDLLNLAGDE